MLEEKEKEKQKGKEEKDAGKASKQKKKKHKKDDSKEKNNGELKKRRASSAGTDSGASSRHVKWKPITDKSIAEGVFTPPVTRRKSVSSDMGNSTVREMAAMLEESDEDSQSVGDMDSCSEAERAMESDSCSEDDGDEEEEDEEDEQDEGNEDEEQDEDEDEEDSGEDDEEDGDELEGSDDGSPCDDEGGEDDKEEKKEEKNGASALVLAVEKTKDLKNSVTDKREWDTFVRSKERFRMFDYFQSNKVELFNIWLDSGKNWDQCQLHVKRSQESRNSSTRGWTSIQGRDIKAKYPAEKAKTLMETRYNAGMYYDDPDFSQETRTTLGFASWG